MSKIKNFPVKKFAKFLRWKMLEFFWNIPGNVLEPLTREGKTMK